MKASWLLIGANNKKKEQLKDAMEASWPLKGANNK
jgi:hypothetical protein